VSALVGALLAWFVYWASDSWVASRAARFALASLVVLMPALGQENTATITDTIWVLAAVAPWAFAARSESVRALVLRSAIVFFASTATLISLVFFPLALGFAAVRRNRATAVVSAAYFVGIALQAGVATQTTDDRPLHAVRDVSKMPEIIGVRAFDQFLLGDRGIQALWAVRVLLVVFVPALVLGGLLAALIGVGRERQTLSLAFIGVAVASLLVVVWGRGTNNTAIAYAATSFLGPGAGAGSYKPNPARYSVIPVLMLASAAAVLFTSLGTSRPRLSRSLTVAFVAQVIVVISIGFPATNARSPGPAWSKTVAAQRARCARRDPTAEVQLRLPAPAFNPAIVVMCRDLGPRQ
jgi:hypothetical protein